jgi:hypothetical protein
MSTRVLTLFLLVLGCEAATKKSTRSPADVFEVTDVTTLAEVQRVLTIKTCEGWRYLDSYPSGEQFVLIMQRRGPAPAPDPECRR